ncbi:MAG: hypothetical protein ACT4SY_12495 [Hyphomicrobiales bacterium]
MLLQDLVTMDLPSVSNLIDLSVLPPESVSMSSLFSGAGTMILGKFTSGVGYLTMPLNYFAMFAGAVAANWLLGGIELPMDQQLQQPLLITLGGMLIGAFAMLWWMHSAHAEV